MYKIGIEQIDKTLGGLCEKGIVRIQSPTEIKDIVFKIVKNNPKVKISFYDIDFGPPHIKDYKLNKRYFYYYDHSFHINNILKKINSRIDKDKIIIIGPINDLTSDYKSYIENSLEIRKFLNKLKELTDNNDILIIVMESLRAMYLGRYGPPAFISDGNQFLHKTFEKILNTDIKIKSVISGIEKGELVEKYDIEIKNII